MLRDPVDATPVLPETRHRSLARAAAVLRRLGRPVATLVRRIGAQPRAPLQLLGLVTVASCVARALWLDRPLDRSLIFDEKYYVSAARVLLHLPVPCHPDGACDPYGTIPGGTDPNPEHPPLGKLFIATGMRWFGDNPFGWRIFPFLFGTLAILAMYWVVRSAGGSPWLALGAAALMAADNLSLVHGRIATLDVFVVVFMLAGVALYVRGHPLVSGLVLGVGCCVKLVAPFAVATLVLLEAIRVVSRRDWRSIRRRALWLGGCTLVTAVVYFGLLDILDIIFKPYHNPTDPCPGSGSTYANSFVHTAYMYCYAGKLTAPEGATGIASYPWQWLVDLWPINYYSLAVNVSVAGQTMTETVIAFTGMINPAIIYLFLPALGLALWTAWRERDDVSALVLAWFLANFLPLASYSWHDHRIEYLYYMVPILPAVYLGVARVLSRRWLPTRWLPIALRVVFGIALVGGFWYLYPIREWLDGPFDAWFP